MKINGTDFNENWVRKFGSAEEFADSPKNTHLFPEMKQVSDRKELLKEVWNFYNPPQTTENDSRENAGESVGAGDSIGDQQGIDGDRTANGPSEQGSNAKRPRLKRGQDNL